MDGCTADWFRISIQKIYTRVAYVLLACSFAVDLPHRKSTGVFPYRRIFREASWGNHLEPPSPFIHTENLHEGGVCFARSFSVARSRLGVKAPRHVTQFGETVTSFLCSCGGTSTQCVAFRGGDAPQWAEIEGRLSRLSQHSVVLRDLRGS